MSAEPAGQIDGELPPEAWVVGLAALPLMGPARLVALLRRWSPEEAWNQVVGGTAALSPGVAASLATGKESVPGEWQVAARATHVEDLWARHHGADLEIDWGGGGGLPEVLADDLEPPGVLFRRGTYDALDGPRVAIVGTRRCTRYGRDVAFDLGVDLSTAGVRVVSGLATGIDAAAHRGALAGGAPPIGVVGTGLDVVYPRSSADLWRDVAEAGLLITEAPLSAPPARWRFPARNRLVAAVADVVVVVESGTSGGSLYTVEEALRRDRPVLAVPGSVHSPASAGTNALLADGAPVCRDATDVLLQLGLSADAGGRGGAKAARPAPDADAAQVLDAIGWEPAEITGLALRTGFELGRLALALDRLEASSWIVRSGAWMEQVAP